MPLDLPRLREEMPELLAAPVFAELASELAPKPATEQAPQGEMLRDVLLALTSGRQRRERLESHLQEQLAQTLRIAKAHVSPQTAFGTLGLDSLMSIELRNRFERSLGVTLSSTMIWNYPTVEALACYLAERMGIPLDTQTDAQPAQAEQLPMTEPDDPELARLLAELDQLSDEEAYRLLTKASH
jgi:acyl carrier protein